jgi:3'-phosphoadenosine 5'-phosphosulfate sulfotransferase (PAPS reductase)/FAD synthetase
MKHKEALLYSKMPHYKNLVSRTQGFIKLALGQVKNPYVACSFGKDSSVMLHLVNLQIPNIPVLFLEYEETALLDNYDYVISQWDLHVHRIMVDSDIEDEINEKDILPLKAIQMGFDAAFVGIRMDESNGRRISIKKHGKFARLNSGIRICPLAEWRVNDVASYCITNNIPLLETYKKFGFFDRTTTGLSGTEYGFREAQLARIRQTDLPRFNAILNKYPKLSKYC